MQRGKVIQYSGETGSGTVSIEGSRYPFELAHWVGDDAPIINRYVDIALADGRVTQVTPVPESTLAQEKAAEIKGALGAHGKQIGARAIQLFGVPMLVCFGAYVLAAFFMPYAVIRAMGASSSLPLSDATRVLDLKGGGMYHMLFLASVAAPFALFFTQQKQAWLTLTLPGLTVLSTVLAAWLEYRSAVAQMQQMQESMGMAASSFMRGIEQQVNFSHFFSMGIGFYVAAAAGFYLLWLAVRKYLTLA